MDDAPDEDSEEEVPLSLLTWPGLKAICGSAPPTGTPTGAGANVGVGAKSLTRGKP
jgi:hypothetical protein